MSLWYCKEHGFVGPMACCQGATLARMDGGYWQAKATNDTASLLKAVPAERPPVKRPSWLARLKARASRLRRRG